VERMKNWVRSRFPRTFSILSACRGTAQRTRDRWIAWRMRRDGFSSTEHLIEAHFRTWSAPDTPTRPGFAAALTRLGGKPATIVETGTSAWGVDSTRLWDEYVRAFGGSCWSVDLRPEPGRRLRRAVSERTHLCLGDSVEFIEGLAARRGVTSVDLFYLDSFDLDPEDPMPSAEHGLREWEALLPYTSTGTLVLVDDTPLDLEWVPGWWGDAAVQFRDRTGFLPGKGALIEQAVASLDGVTKIWHGYNVLYRFE